MSTVCSGWLTEEFHLLLYLHCIDLSYQGSCTVAVDKAHFLHSFLPPLYTPQIGSSSNREHDRHRRASHKSFSSRVVSFYVLKKGGMENEFDHPQF